MGGHDTSRRRSGLVYWWHHTSKHNSTFSVPVQKLFGFQGTSISIKYKNYALVPSSVKKPAILSPRCVHSPCAAMSHARRAGAALTAAPSTTHPGQARPGQSGQGARKRPRGAGRAPVPPKHSISPRLAQAAWDGSRPFGCPLRTPVRPTCSRAATATAAANARKQRGRARAPPPLHWSRITCSHACACTALQLSGACALLLQPLQPLQPPPPPPRGAASTAATVPCRALPARPPRPERAPPYLRPSVPRQLPPEQPPLPLPLPLLRIQTRNTLRAQTPPPPVAHAGPLCKWTPCLLPSLSWPRPLRGHRGRQWGAAPEPANRKASHLGGMQISLCDI